MQVYRVDFRDGRKSIFGTISLVEARQGFFLFLEQGTSDQIGMVGKDGVRINFDDCTGVYAASHLSPGFYGDEDQIRVWKEQGVIR